MDFRCRFEKDERGRTRVSLMQDEQRISGLALWHLPMRVGSSEVMMGGIGGVWTHPDHRMRGHASVVMEESVEWMARNGFDVSVLFGISNFYHRWGYAVTFESSRIRMPVRHAEQAPATCRPRAYTDKDLDVAIRLYNKDASRRTGSIARRKSEWIAWRKGSQWGVKPTVFVYTQGKEPVAVAAFDLRPDGVVCCEVDAPDPVAFGGIMRHAALLGVERRVEHVTFFIAPDAPFADYCRELGCEMIRGVPRNSGGMTRLIDQRRTFEKIAPELTRRLKSSALADWTGGIDVETDLDLTRLNIAQGEVCVGERKGRAKVTLRLPQSRLAQMLMGFQFVDFILRAEPDAKLTGGKDGILDALFGRTFAWMSPPDHF